VSLHEWPEAAAVRQHVTALYITSCSVYLRLVGDNFLRGQAAGASASSPPGVLARVGLGAGAIGELLR